MTYKPGDNVVIEGVPCTMVAGDKVPEKYWNFLKGYRCTTSPSLFVSSKFDGWDWLWFDDLPPAIHATGELSYNDGDGEERATLAVWVPDEYLLPSHNEWGEVSP